ncbi:hypothetical protein B1748_19955 [Paenibacillus sp. MY03]|uniref:sporulation histidine kinase inhibitor Sda n=1 Tax=Paenibacillus sp. MY03 TaxID=302980 RepID=UPI000B3C7DD7|nr:sporulation histidine kinase inhibitor Sda [Paenibacillus sp. MY03]OUS74859.1 hypothetical protein B1748_19955 [Paenibacillus sp. MY03]
MQNNQKPVNEMSDELLLGAYELAHKLSLDKEFIELLKQELIRRGIHINSESE